MSTATKEKPTTVELHQTNVFTFARGLGSAQRKSLNDSEPLYKDWLKASETEKDEMHREFMVGFVMGVLGVVRDSAETVISGRVRFGAEPQAGKPARTIEQQRAYDSARKQFGFHVSREDKKVRERVEQKRVRLSTAFKDAAALFIGQFYEEVNATSIDAIIQQLKALKDRMQD